MNLLRRFISWIRNRFRKPGLIFRDGIPVAYWTGKTMLKYGIGYTNVDGNFKLMEVSTNGVREIATAGEDLKPGDTISIGPVVD